MKETLPRKIFQGGVRHKLGVVPNEGHPTDVARNRTIQMFRYGPHQIKKSENFTTLKAYCEQSG
jgi:hypothetical protein